MFWRNNHGTSVLFFLFSVCCISIADTIPALINSNLDITADDNPHIVLWDVVINTGVTVNINPGSEFLIKGKETLEANEYDSFTDIIVKGTLHIAGTKDSVITFSSNKKQYGSWGQIRFDSGSVGSISHVHLKYAQTGFSIKTRLIDTISDVTIDSTMCGITDSLYQDTLMLNNLTIKNFGNTFTDGNGLFLQGASSYYQITDSYFSGNNTGPGVRIYSIDGVVVVRNCLFINVEHGIYNYYHTDKNGRQLTVELVTIVGSAGDAVVSNATTSTVTNSIIARGHTGLSSRSDVEFISDYNNLCDNDQNYSQVNSGANDVSIDPLFMDEENGDYRLQSISPLRTMSSTGGEIGFYGTSTNHAANCNISGISAQKVLCTVTPQFVRIALPYSIHQAALWVIDPKGRMISFLTQQNAASSDKRTAIWDRKDRYGHDVKPGLYVISIDANDYRLAGNILIY